MKVLAKGKEKMTEINQKRYRNKIASTDSLSVLKVPEKTSSKIFYCHH